jgi:hypothetical protein
VIPRLRTILKQWEEAKINEATDKTTFDKPDWALYQAYLSGQREVLRDLLRITEFIDNGG